MAEFDPTFDLGETAELIFLTQGIHLSECVELPEHLIGIDVSLGDSRYKSLELLVDEDVRWLDGYKKPFTTKDHMTPATIPGLYIEANATYGLILHEETPIGCVVAVEFSHGFPHSYLSNADFERFALLQDLSAFDRAYQRLQNGQIAIKEGTSCMAIIEKVAADPTGDEEDGEEETIISPLPDKPYNGTLCKRWLLRSFFEKHPPYEKELIRVPASFFAISPESEDYSYEN